MESSPDPVVLCEVIPDVLDELEAAGHHSREDELASMSYPEYLLTREWRTRRREALERAGHRCQVCNRDYGLHVHHRTYERRGRELPGDLTVLCYLCHALFHGKEPKEPNPKRKPA
jgi:hypothetical protein